MILRTLIILFLLLGSCAIKEPFDPERAATADVVLRVKKLSDGEGSKYWWYEVQIISVLKSDAAGDAGATIKVAARGGRPGIPDGKCTIYLERYNKIDQKYWMLLGGDASRGVSHVSR